MEMEDGLNFFENRPNFYLNGIPPKPIQDMVKDLSGKLTMIEVVEINVEKNHKERSNTKKQRPIGDQRSICLCEIVLLTWIANSFAIQYSKNCKLFYHAG
jgi:hypothetical protein